MNLSLENRTALICGSSQGIGKAIAAEVALLGANCILVARNEEQLKKVIQTLDTSKGQKHSYEAIDLNDQQAVKSMITKTVAKTTVSILVNNSGGPKAGPIIDASGDQFLEAFHQHVITDHILVQAVVEGMKKQKFGRIINVISTSVKTPLANLGVSNTIRAAVAAWAKTLSNELAQYGITVNNVLPGFTRTARLDSLIQGTSESKGIPKEEVERQMASEVPAKRFGDPSEIAAYAAFLATPAASYINGTSVPVDGGRTDAF